jgi:hypothetical protein
MVTMSTFFISSILIVISLPAFAGKTEPGQSEKRKFEVHANRAKEVDSDTSPEYSSEKTPSRKRQKTLLEMDANSNRPQEKEIGPRRFSNLSNEIISDENVTSAEDLRQVSAVQSNLRPYVHPIPSSISGCAEQSPNDLASSQISRLGADFLQVERTFRLPQMINPAHPMEPQIKSQHDLLDPSKRIESAMMVTSEGEPSASNWDNSGQNQFHSPNAIAPYHHNSEAELTGNQPIQTVRQALQNVHQANQAIRQANQTVLQANQIVRQANQVAPQATHPVPQTQADGPRSVTSLISWLLESEECPVETCGKWSIRYKLGDHIALHHPEAQTIEHPALSFVCPVKDCAKISTDSASLLSHLQLVHTGRSVRELQNEHPYFQKWKQKVKCPLPGCNNTYVRYRLKDHFEKIHTDIEDPTQYGVSTEWTCPGGCAGIYGNFGSVARHYKVVHEQEAQHKHDPKDVPKNTQSAIMQRSGGERSGSQWNTSAQNSVYTSGALAPHPYTSGKKLTDGNAIQTVRQVLQNVRHANQTLRQATQTLSQATQTVRQANQRVYQATLAAPHVTPTVHQATQTGPQTAQRTQNQTNDDQDEEMIDITQFLQDEWK